MFTEYFYVGDPKRKERIIRGPKTSAVLYTVFSVLNLTSSDITGSQTSAVAFLHTESWTV